MSESFYSPWQVQRELRQLTTEFIPRQPPPAEEERVRRTLTAWWPMETAVCIRADIAKALSELRAISELHYQVVFRFNVPGPGGTPDGPRVTFASLARELGHDWETIRRANIDGIGWMSAHLGWDGNWPSWYQRPR